MQTYSSQRGFTLLEIMIAVAVIAILLGIAMPTYTNYSVRAKVSECIGLATTAKLAVNDRVMRNGQAPGSSSEAGFTFNQTEYCGDIRIADSGTVVVETQNTGAADDPVIQFRLDLNTAIASVDWDCEYVSGDPAHVPSSCRALGAAATGGDSTAGSGSDGGTSGGSGGGTSGGNGGGTGGSGTGGSGTGDDGDSGQGDSGQGDSGEGDSGEGDSGGGDSGGGPDCENLPPQANPPQCRDGGGPGNGKGKGKRG